MKEEVGTLTNGKIHQSDAHDALLFGIYCSLPNFTTRSIPSQTSSPHFKGEGRVPKGLHNEAQTLPQRQVRAHSLQIPQCRVPVQHRTVTFAVSPPFLALIGRLVYLFCPPFSLLGILFLKGRPAVDIFVCGLTCFFLSL